MNEDNAHLCEFCGNTMDHHFYSGSYDGYYDCEMVPLTHALVIITQLETLLKESAELFRFYEDSHRKRGPEHLEKAERNAEIAGRIEHALK